MAQRLGADRRLNRDEAGIARHRQVQRPTTQRRVVAVEEEANRFLVRQSRRCRPHDPANDPFLAVSGPAAFGPSKYEADIGPRRLPSLLSTPGGHSASDLLVTVFGLKP